MAVTSGVFVAVDVGFAVSVGAADGVALGDLVGDLDGITMVGFSDEIGVGTGELDCSTVADGDELGVAFEVRNGKMSQPAAVTAVASPAIPKATFCRVVIGLPLAGRLVNVGSVGCSIAGVTSAILLPIYSYLQALCYYFRS
jgi:hypothetical protein